MPCNLIMTPQEFEIELRNSSGLTIHSEYLTYPGPMQQTIAIALTQGLTHEALCEGAAKGWGVEVRLRKKMDNGYFVVQETKWIDHVALQKYIDFLIEVDIL